MCNYNYLCKYSITNEELSDINGFLTKCSDKDNYHYDLQYEEELLEIPSYYFCYSNNAIIGLLTICKYSSDTLCLYSIISPEFRNKHIFTNIFKIFCTKLNSIKQTYTSLEFHLPDENSDFYYTAIQILKKYDFALSHKEYLLYFSLTENSEKSLISKSFLSDNLNLELLYDDSLNEFSLWIGDDYIGGCMIYFSEDINKSFATIYDYEITKEYQGKGLGKAGLYLILDELQSMNYQKVILHVSGLNKKAHNLYISCGFKIQSSINIFTKNI